MPNDEQQQANRRIVEHARLMSQLKLSVTVVGFFKELRGANKENLDKSIDTVGKMQNEKLVQYVDIPQASPLSLGLYSWGISESVVSNFMRIDDAGIDMDEFVAGKDKENLEVIKTICTVPFDTYAEARNWLSSDNGKQFKKSSSLCFIAQNIDSGRVWL